MVVSTRRKIERLAPCRRIAANIAKLPELLGKA
jgi:hypothetical protein